MQVKSSCPPRYSRLTRAVTSDDHPHPTSIMREARSGAASPGASTHRAARTSRWRCSSRAGRRRRRRRSTISGCAPRCSRSSASCSSPRQSMPTWLAGLGRPHAREGRLASQRAAVGHRAVEVIQRPGEEHRAGLGRFGGQRLGGGVHGRDRGAVGAQRPPQPLREASDRAEHRPAAGEALAVLGQLRDQRADVHAAQCRGARPGQAARCLPVLDAEARRPPGRRG